jgi:hypothetical protein
MGYDTVQADTKISGKIISPIFGVESFYRKDGSNKSL